MQISGSAIIKDEQFIKGLGYQDGYFRENLKPPELWKVWNEEQRRWYQDACIYGAYMRFKRDSSKMVHSYFALWKGMLWIG